MRKRIFGLLSLVFLLTALALVFMLVDAAPSAHADDKLASMASSFKGCKPVYGSKFTSNNATADADGYIPVEVDVIDPGTPYETYTVTFKSAGGWRVKASEIWVFPMEGDVRSDTAVPLCDEQGVVCVDVGIYHFTYQNGTGNFVFPVGHSWTVYQADHSLAGYVVDGIAYSSSAVCEVQPRAISVTVDVASSTTHDGDPLLSEYDAQADVTYLCHRFGDLPDNIVFDLTAGGSLYGSDYLPIGAIAITGNDASSTVGDYFTEGEGSTFTVLDALDQPSNNYVVTVQDIHLRVKPRPVSVSPATYGFDADISTWTPYGYESEPVWSDIGFTARPGMLNVLFTQEVSSDYRAIFSDAPAVSTQMVCMHLADVAGHSLDVFYDVLADESHDPFDSELGSPSVGIGIWPIRQVGFVVDYDDEDWDPAVSAAFAANYEVTTAAGDWAIAVSARPITIYDANHLKEGTIVGDNWVDISTLAETSGVYGALYTGQEETLTIHYGIIELHLTYEIATEVAGVKRSLAQYIQYLIDNEDLDEIVYDEQNRPALRLPVHDYPLVNSRVDDPHYIITPDDDSLYWSVQPQPVTFASLSGAFTQSVISSKDNTDEAKAFAAFLRGVGKSDAYCVQSYAFDLGTTTRTRDVAFVDAVGQTVTLSSVTCADCLYPGYYALTLARGNYAFDSDLVYIRIKPIPTAAVVPAESEYDAKTRQAEVLYYVYDNSLAGNEDRKPISAEGLAQLDVLADWSVSLLYDGAAALPINAGRYRVTGTVKGPQNAPAYNPYLSEPGATYLVITQAVRTIRITSTDLTKVYGADSDPIVYEPRTLFGDTVGLSCDGLQYVATPGAYPISVSVTNAGNYRLSLVDSSNRANPFYNVVKVPVATLVDYLNRSFIVTAPLKIDNAGLHLADISYDELPLDQVFYQYRQSDKTSEEWTTVADGTLVGWWNEENKVGIKEGIKYDVRIVVRAGKYVDAAAEMTTDTVSVQPALSVPTLEQDVIRTTTTTIVMRIVDYHVDVENSDEYALVLLSGNGTTYDPEAQTITVGDLVVSYADFADDEHILNQLVAAAKIKPKEDGTYTHLTAYAIREAQHALIIDTQLMVDLVAGGTYYAFAVHKTEFSKVCTLPYVMSTRAAAPTFTTDDLTITALSVTVPEGYSYTITEYDNASKLDFADTKTKTFTMRELKYTYEQLALQAGKIYDLQGNELAALSPNTEYVLVIWADGDQNGVPSDALCMYIYTPSITASDYGYSPAMTIVAEYLLVGLVGLNLVLFIICVVRYAFIKRNTIKKFQKGGRK